MSIYQRALFLTVVVSAVSGCLNGPGFMKKGNGEVENKDSTAAPVEKDEAGVLTASISANASGLQTISASGDSAISDASVTFPPGSITIDTAVTIEQGATVVSDSVAAEIGLAGVGIAPAGEAVVLSSLVPTDAAQPFTVAIPLSSSQLQLVENNPLFLVVIYKVYKAAEGKYVVGVLPYSKLTVKDGKVYFDTQYFGVYQAAYPESEIKEAKEADTSAPILTKAKEKTLQPVTWQGVDIGFDSQASTLTVHGSASGINALSQCIVFADRDKVPPFDFSAAAGASFDAEISFANVNDGTYFVRMNCTEDNGRASSSDWSSKSFLYKKPVKIVDEDKTGPKPQLFNPADGATGIARNASITVTFDEPISPVSLASGCFGVKGPNGTYISPAGPYTLTNSNKTVILVPASQLAMSAKYTVVLPADCVKDTNNNGTPGAIWSFTTMDGTWSSVSDLDATPVDGVASTAQGAMNAAGDQVLSFLTPDLYTPRFTTRKLPATTWTSENVGAGSMGPGADLSLDVRPALYGNGAVTLPILRKSSGTGAAAIDVGSRQPGQPWQPLIPLHSGSDESCFRGFDTAFDGNRLMVAWAFDGDNARISGFNPSLAITPITSAILTVPAAGKVRLKCNKAGDCIFGVGQPAGFQSSFQVHGTSSWTEKTFSYATSALGSNLFELFLDEAGKATVVWIETSAPNKVKQSTSVAGGNWSAPVELGQFNGTINSFDAALRSNGDVVVAWRETLTVNAVLQSGVKVAYYDGTSVQSATAIPQVTVSMTSGDTMKMVANATGALAIVATTPGTGDAALYGAILPANAPVNVSANWKSAKLDPGNGMYQNANQFLDDAGNATTTWYNANTGVGMSRFTNATGAWSVGSTLYGDASAQSGVLIGDASTGNLLLPVGNGSLIKFIEFH